MDIRSVNTDNLAHAWGGPVCRGTIRHHLEDFVVDEYLSFEPSGAGEHACLRIKKTDLNTAEVADVLARFAGVSPSAVGYAGLKDRKAICTQWFSVHLPGRVDPDWSGLAVAGVEILTGTRHERKLKRGAIAHNRFQIRLRQIEAASRPALEDRLRTIQQAGVPNYFGPQRFGRGGQNVARALDMFAGRPRRLSRHKQSLYLSAARSFLFNEILSQRVSRGCWAEAMPGEVFNLAGSRSVFVPEPSRQDDVLLLPQRLQQGDIHPTAALWGRGVSQAIEELADLEQAVAAHWPELTRGLEASGLTQDRRATRLAVKNLSWTFGNDIDELTLAFELGSGAFATAVLRELIKENAV